MGRTAVPIIVIQEAGLNGFWIHRLLQGDGIESYVVDPTSIATSRRRRRKPDISRVPTDTGLACRHPDGS